MPTITVRNVPAKAIQSLKALAHRHKKSMEQEVRDLIEGYVAWREASAEVRPAYDRWAGCDPRDQHLASASYLAETRVLDRDAALEQVRARCLELAPPPAPDWDR